MNFDTFQKAGVWKKQSESLTFCKKLLCSLFLCSLGFFFFFLKIKPSWKNQKADALIIEVGKGNRNLVIGVTGPRTPINLGGVAQWLWVSLHRCPRGEALVGKRLRCSETLLETQGPGPSPSPDVESLSSLRRAMSRGVLAQGRPWRSVGHSKAHPRASRGAPTAMTQGRILLPAIYHSAGKTNLKHLDIYVSDGSSCTVPLY